MKRTLTVYSSNREPPQAFTRSVERLMLAGCPVVPQTGTADVSLARNLALTAAVQALRAGTPVDVVLMVDDDMAFELRDVEHIAGRVRSSGHAASAAYCMGDGRLAAHYVGPRWHTGLGFLAMPAMQLLQLANESVSFRGTPDGKSVIEFTRSAVVARGDELVWSPEDFFLCERLGGVDLLRLRIAHMKTVPLMAHPESLDALIAQHEERPSPTELNDFAASLRQAVPA
jgi:hypothetical protein